MKVSLGDVCVARSSLVDPTHDEYRDLPHVAPDSIEKDTGRILKVRSVSEDGVRSGKYRFEPGDVLYSKIRPNLNKVALVDFAGLCSADIYALDVDPEHAAPQFVAHLLRSPNFMEYATSLSNRANIPKLNRDQLMRYQVDLPSTQEQRRIAAILDQADALRAMRRQVLAHLDTLIKSIFHDLFGAFGQWRWPTSRVDEVGRVQLGRQRSPKYQTGMWTHPYLRVANVQMNRLDLSDVLTMDFNSSDSKAYRLEVGDILLNEGQNTELVGRPAMWRGEIPGCCFQNTLLRFQSNRQKLQPEFALHVFLELLRAGQFARISSKTSNVAHLGRERFAAVSIPVPPLDLQQKFVRRLDGVESQRAAVARAVGVSDLLFESLQARAFRGEL